MLITWFLKQQRLLLYSHTEPAIFCVHHHDELSSSHAWALCCSRVTLGQQKPPKGVLVDHVFLAQLLRVTTLQGDAQLACASSLPWFLKRMYAFSEDV